MERIFGIILAAGCGSRMGSDITKQRMLILGKTVLRRAYDAFADCDEITDIIVVAREDELDVVKAELCGAKKLFCIVAGGNSRAESARCGFLAAADAAYVAIHDAARCIVSPADISRVISDAKRYGAASAVVSVYDTVKEIGDDGFIASTHDRTKIKLAATPQVFRYSIYKAALDKAVDLSRITDDNMLVEKSGYKIYATEVSRANIKITHSEDIPYAEFLIGGKDA